MITYLIYTINTSGQKKMEEYSERLADIGVKAELVDAASQHGTELCEYYDILARPAIILTREDDGSVIQVWAEAESFPGPGEISYYAHL